MTALRSVLLAAAATGAGLPAWAAGGLPTVPGTCAPTRIAAIGTRLADARTGRPIPGSGSAVTFANQGYQVSYEEVAAIAHARVGDPVYLCLMRIPQGCPRGDSRGRIYTATDLRTMQSWTLPDSEHGCGGA